MASHIIETTPNFLYLYFGWARGGGLQPPRGTRSSGVAISAESVIEKFLSYVSYILCVVSCHTYE